MQGDHDGHVLAVFQGGFGPGPDGVVHKLDLALVAKGPDVAVRIGEGRAVGLGQGQLHVGGERPHLVDEAVVEAVGVVIGPHQAVEGVAQGVGVGAVLADAPAQLHALPGLHHAALAGLLGKVGAHVPAGQRLIGPPLVGDGEVRDGQVAVVPAGEIKLGALVGGGRPGLGDVS